MSKNRTYGKWSILFTVLIMTFMVTLDGSIVNVALPVMSGELNASMGDIEWVASIYLVVTCATILIFGQMCIRDRTMEQLHAAIAALPDKHAKRIYAYYFLGLTESAIAKREGVSVASVSESIQRGLRNM